MKQLLQSLKTGTGYVSELPSPMVSSGHLLISSSCSLVSAGTERMLLDFGKANWIDKARQQPDKVQQVLDKAKTDGILTTIDSIQSKLDQPLALGYCNVGTVLQVGSGVSGFKPGDRVVSNGSHAELVLVPHHLCSLIPNNVTDESAAFTVLASIGLQGIRLANPTFGETFVVSGLGLIGLLTSQLLLAQGCRVLGFDPDPRKCALAESFGITVLNIESGSDPVTWCNTKTNGLGVDGVLITAATSSSEPVHVAAKVCRQRGRIVLVGVTGLELRRDLFYKKELSFQVSCSYGPGRYDPHYEEEGHDYPIGFVRWTEQRNLQAVLHAFASGSLSTNLLISHRFSIDNSPNAYELLTSSEPYLGILITYSGEVQPDNHNIKLATRVNSLDPSSPVLSVIGAGNYSSRILIPVFARAGACFHSLAAPSGIGPTHVGSKFGFTSATTDIPSLFADPTSNCVVIATRHDSHASLVIQALSAGKHVFVEKPLCLTLSELDAIELALTEQSILMVGFNRRFAPLLIDLKTQLSRFDAPKAFVYTCNAGPIPSEHWIQDPSRGGGRLLGEACHFVDLIRNLADSSIEDMYLLSASDPKPCPDTFSLQIRFRNGSIGTVHYFANGSKAFPKERLEVFVSGKIFRLDNFRKLQAWGIPSFRTRRRFSQDKGQFNCCSAFLLSIKNGRQSPIPVSELIEVQRWLLQVVS